jgi:hypothetical protein
MTENKSEGGGVTRLSFIKASAGVAAGAAAVGVPAAVLSGEKQREVTEPSSPAPREPVMAYVHDARRGEVTVMFGTKETTYRDRALVKRLLAAAPKDGVAQGGGIDVLAP